MDSEICTIEIGSGFLDNDYIFYDDGRIKHLYDQNAYKPNQIRWLKASEISESQKYKILEKCPEDYKERIKIALEL